MADRLHFSMEMDTKSIDIIEDILDDYMDSFLDELTEEIEWSWRKLAGEDPRLRSSRAKYLDAIEVHRDGDEIVLGLTDELAAALEEGSEPYDLKPGFLRGKTHRIIPLVDSGTNNVTRFRTVTVNSQGWIHPGYKPVSITEKVQVELESNLIGEVFSRVLSRSKI